MRDTAQDTVRSCTVSPNHGEFDRGWPMFGDLSSQGDASGRRPSFGGSQTDEASAAALVGSLTTSAVQSFEHPQPISSGAIWDKTLEARLHLF